MATLFEKLNLKDHQEILILHAPESLERELSQLPVITIHRHLESLPEIRFSLAFVTRQAEVDALAPQVAAKARGDAMVWFAYPKGTSKKYKCDFNRDTGWAALNRDPLEDLVEYTCPHCGARGTKAARRPRSAYHFTDGFVQDVQGEMTTCRNCKQSLRVSPVVLLHDQGEQRRFNAVFLPDLEVSKN